MKVSYPELPVFPLHPHFICLDGADLDAEPPGYLKIFASFNHQLQDVLFPFG